MTLTPSVRRLLHVWSSALALGLLVPLVFASAPRMPPNRHAQVQALLAEIDADVENDPALALSKVQRAIELARTVGDKKLSRDVHIKACEVTVLNDAQAGLRLSEAGLREAKRDYGARAGYRGCKAYALEELGKAADAAMEYDIAVADAERAGDAMILASVLAPRGESLHYRGRYDDAIADLNRAYALYLELQHSYGQRYTLNAIANVYSDANVGEYDKAIGYYNQLLKHDEASSLRAGIATTRFNIAGVLQAKGELDAALKEYERALQIDTELGNARGKADSERAIGALLTKQGKAKEALEWIERSLAYSVRIDHDEGVAITRVTRSRALRALGRLREAEADLEFAQRHFRRAENPRQLAAVYKSLAEIRAELEDWRGAYTASMEYRRLQDELEKRAREEQTSRLRVQFDTARKEQENRALLIENAHRGEALRNAERVRAWQRLTILLGAALVVMLGTMALQQIGRGRRLKQLAMTDELTDLPNRRHIIEFFERALREARSDHRPLAIIVFDVDHFKRINDVHGHLGGDRVLRKIAEIARMHLPQNAQVGRMGGEEFLLVLPGAEPEATHRAAEALRTAIAEGAFGEFRQDERITISLGTACMGEGDDLESLLKRADAALYRAKHEGRDRVVAS